MSRQISAKRQIPIGSVTRSLKPVAFARTLSGYNDKVWEQHLETTLATKNLLRRKLVRQYQMWSWPSAKWTGNALERGRQPRVRFPNSTFKNLSFFLPRSAIIGEYFAMCQIIFKPFSSNMHPYWLCNIKSNEAAYAYWVKVLYREGYMLLISTSNLTQFTIGTLEAFWKHIFWKLYNVENQLSSNMRILKTVCLLRRQDPVGLERVETMLIHAVMTAIANPKSEYKQSKLKRSESRCLSMNGGLTVQELLQCEIIGCWVSWKLWAMKFLTYLNKRISRNGN